MQIDDLILPRRSPPFDQNPKRHGSIGVSQAGDVLAVDYGTKEYDVLLTFLHLDKFTATIVGVDELRDYLMNTIKPGGAVTVIPDYLDPPTNSHIDDLGVGATITGIDLIFIDFKATWKFGYKFSVQIFFKYFI